MQRISRMQNAKCKREICRKRERLRERGKYVENIIQGERASMKHECIMPKASLTNKCWAVAQSDSCWHVPSTYLYYSPPAVWGPWVFRLPSGSESTSTRSEPSSSLHAKLHAKLRTVCLIDLKNQKIEIEWDRKPTWHEPVILARNPLL